MLPDFLLYDLSKYIDRGIIRESCVFFVQLVNLCDRLCKSYLCVCNVEGLENFKVNRKILVREPSNELQHFSHSIKIQEIECVNILYGIPYRTKFLTYKIFDTKPKFRQFCPSNFYPIRYTKCFYIKISLALKFIYFVDSTNQIIFSKSVALLTALSIFPFNFELLVLIDSPN